MYSKGDRIITYLITCVIMIYDNAEELFESLLDRYQIGLETSIRSSDVVFDCVDLFYSNVIKWNQIVVAFI